MLNSVQLDTVIRSIKKHGYLQNIRQRYRELGSPTAYNSGATGSADRPSAALRKCYLSQFLRNGNGAKTAPGTSVPRKRWPKLQTDGLFKAKKENRNWLLQKTTAVHGEYKLRNNDNNHKPQEYFMNFIQAISGVFFGATICVAQIVNISGTVKDSAGVGIAGALVKLEKADISATTSTNGSFALTGEITSIQLNGNNYTIAESSFRFDSGRLDFTLSENTSFTVSIYDIRGKTIFSSSRKKYSTGRHSITVPQLAYAIHLCKIKIGEEPYSFKLSPLGTFSNESKKRVNSNVRSAKQAKVTAEFADNLLITKEGQLNYRGSINSSDTSGIVVTMLPNAGNVTDADGNIYQSVRIGNQVWTVENLRTTKYNDNEAIPHITDSTDWRNLSTPGYCFYSNSADTKNQEKWGALYNWYAVNTGKLAPAGWHVSTDTDWITLSTTLGGLNIAGGKLKESGTANWQTPNSGATNECGFSALPAGSRSYSGYFSYQGTHSYWWSAAVVDATRGYCRYLIYYGEGLDRYIRYKKYGFSVRLVRD